MKFLPKKKEVKKVEQVKETPQQVVLSCLHDFVYLLVAVLLICSLLFRVVVVSGPSMNDTLVHGDWLILLNSAVTGEPKYGDVIVASKKSFANGEPIIKRVIATEGQEVNIDFRKGIVYVDGEPLNESYTLTPTNIQEGMEFPLVVDEGCIFVMGDNRNISKDSRSTEIGLIDCREVMGKAIFILYPGTDKLHPDREFNRIGVIK